MSGVGLEIIYDPDDEARDITDKVLIKSARLESSNWAQPGIWQATIKDIDRDQEFITGKRISWKLDGTTFYGGFVTQVTKAFAFPADDTSNLASVKTRQFQLRGVDYNILFDKRVMRRPGGYQKRIPQFDRTSDSTLVQQACSEYLDLPNWLDCSSGVEVVGQIPAKAGTKGSWVQQGSAWRKQMQSFSAHTGAIWYIRATDDGAELVWRAVEDVVAPYTLSDKPTGDEQGFRELQYTEDASGMVNDALVWGGSEYANVDGWPRAKVIFARAENSGSIADHNRWQWAESHFGDVMNYSSQEEVDRRAEIIVLGRTGDTVYFPNRGLQNPNETFTIAWHHTEVPKSGGVFQFIRPGDLTTLNLNVFNKVVILPCRSISVTFPSGTDTGDAIVRFEGTFSLQVNDPWTLWQAIAARKVFVVPNL